MRKYMLNPNYRFLINAGFGKYDDMPDKEYLERKFECCTGKQLDLNNPETFNEKLQWLKLYDRKPEYRGENILVLSILMIMFQKKSVRNILSHYSVYGMLPMKLILAHCPINLS